MAKHLSFVPIIVLLVVLLASPCDAESDEEYLGNRTRCQSMLDKGAPKCYRDVYLTSFLPLDHVQCCKNYLKMDKEEHRCWYYLFDDPTSTMAMELNLLRCRLEREPPVDRHNWIFVKCRKRLNEGVPNCWEDVYFKHKLPKKNHTECCWNFREVEYNSPTCWAYLFQYPESTLVLKDILEKCPR